MNDQNEAREGLRRKAGSGSGAASTGATRGAAKHKDTSGYDFPDPQFEDSYSPDKFYVQATDSRGHSQQTTVYFPPQIHAQIRATVEHPQFPYRSNSDFIRDSVRHRLQYLNAHTDDLDFRMATLRFFVWTDAEQQAQMLLRMEEAADALIAQLGEIVSKARKKGRHEDWIHRQLRMFRAKALGMDDPWKTEVLAAIDELAK